MTTMIVNIDNSTDVQSIFATISQLKGVLKVRLQENTEFSCIPGLSDTYVERMKDIRQAEEDYATGRTITSEEFKKRVALW